jgi:DNA-directed RNA polymerase III subunit RPC8
MFQLILLKDIIHIAPHCLPIIADYIGDPTADTTTLTTTTMDTSQSPIERKPYNTNSTTTCIAIESKKATAAFASTTDPITASHPFHAVIVEQICIKYANRVIPNHGLVITVHGIESIGDVKIHPIDSGAHIECQFRCIVFNPLPGEIIVGTVKHSDSTGILVSVDFFDWIVVPAAELQRPSTYDPNENVWIWKYEDHELFLDIGEQIRMRITDILYATQPLPTTIDELNPNTESQQFARKPNRVTIDNCQPAMKVTATIAADGLGILSWWG